MFTGLSLDQAPPFEAPLKFFLSAPIFAILAGIIGFFSSSFELHDPNLIASIHLITIGYMIMIIFGALQQMLPVVAGAVIPKAKLVANITYILLTIGLTAFVVGFYFYEKIHFFIAAAFLLLGLCFFTFIALFQLLKVANKSYIVIGMILSLTFFILAFLFGIHLVISHATGNISPLHYNFAALHYNYIFFGFIFLLIVAITIQVVPMFWVASSYTKTEQKLFIIPTALLLVFYFFNTLFNLELTFLYKLIISAIALFFVYVTIDKLQTRKRKLKDISVYFYITSMVSLALGVLYWISCSFAQLPLLPLGVLFGFGFTISLMNGMIYKIVPFLTWFHLNSRGLFDIPTMREMIPIKKMEQQFLIHVNSLILLTLGTFFQSNLIIYIALALFILSNLVFFRNIYKAANIYLQRRETL